MALSSGRSYHYHYQGEGVIYGEGEGCGNDFVCTAFDKQLLLSFIKIERS